MVKLAVVRIEVVLVRVFEELALNASVGRTF
jgi:hypothetical protein